MGSNPTVFASDQLSAVLQPGDVGGLRLRVREPDGRTPRVSEPPRNPSPVRNLRRARSSHAAPVWCNHDVHVSQVPVSSTKLISRPKRSRCRAAGSGRHTPLRRRQRGWPVAATPFRYPRSGSPPHSSAAIRSGRRTKPHPRHSATGSARDDLATRSPTVDALAVSRGVRRRVGRGGGNSNNASHHERTPRRDEHSARAGRLP